MLLKLSIQETDQILEQQQSLKFNSKSNLQKAVFRSRMQEGSNAYMHPQQATRMIEDPDFMSRKYRENEIEGSPFASPLYKI